MKRRILIVEDDIALLETLTDRLESDGYLVRAGADGNSGFGQARDGGFDLIVLDLMLPGRDGLNICTDLRHRRVTTPILMLTARGDVTDRVLGLRMGADDYLPKPFHMSELAARVDALIRRSSARKADPVAFRFGTLEIDFRAGRISREGRPITLAAREWELLRVPGRARRRGSLEGGTAQGSLGPCPRPDHANRRCAYSLAASKAGTGPQESAIDPHGSEARLQTGQRVCAGCGAAARDRLFIS